MIECKFENGNKANLRHVTIDAIVIKNNKILLVKRAKSKLLEGGKYALPGGHLDRDENTSQGILRELREETGCEGKIISLFRIIDKPDRKGEDRQNVDFVYLVEADRQKSKPDDESSEVKWFDLNNLPDEGNIAFDHFETIQLFLQHQKEKTKLPIQEL